MQYIFFDKDNRILFRRSDAITAHFVHEELKHTATFPDDPHRPIQRGMRVGWRDRNGDLLMFEIRVPVHVLPDSTVSYTAEHICISELMDEVVQDKRCYGVTASDALSRALEDTEWNVGRVDVDPVGSDNFYWIKAWEAAGKVRSGWGVRVWPRIAFDGTRITGKYLDILSNAGTFRGVRLQLNRNVERAGVTYDDRNLVTALYGRGKGEAVGTNEDGETTYGRKITFDDVIWSKASGDPADKPAGQLYVEDVQATALYGRSGRPRFGVVNFDDCEDKNELLSLTWDELQRRKVPSVTIDMTLLNLRDIGYTDQGLALGDLANVIIDPFGIRAQAKVIQLDEDLISPENTRPVIGSAISNIIDKDIGIKQNASIGQQIAQAIPESLLQGYIDTAVLQIMSSKTRRETLADGSEMYVTDDGTKAVRFTGAGILIANGKDSTGDWNWRTAITGSGIVADMITSGTLNANLIKILGTGTTLNGTSLTIKNTSVAANASVSIGLDGLKMMVGSKIIGGFYKISNTIRAAFSMLYNPDEPYFSAIVGASAAIGESAQGIQLNWRDASAGFLGPYTSGGTAASGVALRANGNLDVSAANGQMRFHSDYGGMTFTFVGRNSQGYETDLSFTAQQVWNAILATGQLD